MAPLSGKTGQGRFFMSKGGALQMKQVLSILVRNQPGVLMRVAGLFSRRGFNIDSLAVGITEKPAFSRMTVGVYGNEATVEQVKKQLEKLSEVEEVRRLPADAMVSRGMALIKVAAGERRMEVLKLAEIFRASVLDVGGQTLVFEITGAEDKIRAFAEALTPFGIFELVQTGVVALERGESAMQATTSKYNWPERFTGVKDGCQVI